MRWTIFCRVIDNFGDIGVCWRLAADLAGRGERVLLVVDDASALAWMAPQGAAGVEVRAWPADDDAGLLPGESVGDVVIEAFGCELPPAFIAAMAAQSPPPVWINLEYLSAEEVVERNHRLRSPQFSGPARGLDKWFFYPGFSARTGGLLREADLAQRLAAFDAHAWLQSHGIARADGERLVSLFCYENPALPALLEVLAGSPTCLLVTPGHAARQVKALLGSSGARGALRAHDLPHLTQRDYDHLLWACDLNLVRGEDSFVRAQWAGKPFLWQIYPQDDGVHAVKLDAFQRHFLAGAAAELSAAVTSAGLAWNRLAPPHTLALPAGALWADWHAHCLAWRDHLLALPELASSLQAFVHEHR